MNKPSRGRLAIGALILLLASCQQTSHAPVVGNWKMNSLHIVQFDEQMNQLQAEISSLTDSLSAAADSATKARLQSTLDSYNGYLSQMMANKDSSLKNTYWNFKGDGSLDAQEGGDKHYSGYWSYNEKTQTITRFLPSDSVKVTVKGDTLILNLDSVNHINFVRQK